MMRTFTPSHLGAFHGSLVSSGPSGAPPPTESSTGGGFSEPVTWSNGFRFRIGSALVLRAELFDAGAVFATGGGAASAFSSGPRLIPTSCVTACALSRAAIATNGRITIQKFFLRS
jgi:hypothetical protein